MLRVFSMLVPALLVAAGNLSPVQAGNAAIASRPPPGGAQFRPVVGVVDTIGWTTIDNLMSGPAWRMLVNSPGHGIHATWMYSGDTSGPYPDRNMRYSFYDDSLGSRRWQEGVNVFFARTGYGSLDVDTNGVAVISAHHVTGPGPSDLAPIVARDVEPGAGIFDYSQGEPTLDGYLWPCVGVGTNGCYHLAMIDVASLDSLYWSRPTEQGWDSAVSIPPPMPEPLFPTHNIATSKVSGSNKVCITWVATPAVGYAQLPGFHRESQDGGDNWDQPETLGFPPAFSPGSDTHPSFEPTSLFPFYDKHDRLHIVVDLHVVVHGVNYHAPSELWHFCPDNFPQWTRIHRAGAYNPQDSTPTYACRPSIGEDQGGGLYVAWEQFDSSNVEPGPPACARADIFYAQDNGDNGASWQPAVRITDQDTWTCRFPSAIDHFEGDTFRILYLMDQHAGYSLNGEGPATRNPVVVHKVPVTSQSVNDREQMVLGPELAVPPSPFKERTRLSYCLPKPGRVRLEVFDLSGRTVAILVDGFKPAGRHSAAFSARNLAPGVYVARLSSAGSSTTRKLVLTE
jgi:hypothetical protein